MKENSLHELTRNDESIQVELIIEYSYESGEYLEKNHPLNGYGKGLYIDDITARDPQTREPILLTEEEFQEISQDFAARRYIKNTN